MIFKIPVGNIVGDTELKTAIESLTDQLLKKLQSRWGASVYYEDLGEQNQVTDDDKDVTLKWLSRGIRLRDGLFRGVNADIQWDRDVKDVLQIRIYEKTAFEDRMFAASFVLSGLISVLLIFSSANLRRGEVKIIAGVVFVSVLLSLWIAIWIIRVLIKPGSRALREDVEKELCESLEPASLNHRS